MSNDYRKNLVWNPFKRDFWRKDNLLPPESREELRTGLSEVRETMAADLAKSKTAGNSLMRIGWRLTWMITLPVLLSVILGIVGMIIGGIIFLIGLAGLFRK